MYENTDRQADYRFIGIEMTADYLPICEARIAFAEADTRKIETKGVEQDGEKIEQIHF